MFKLKHNPYESILKLKHKLVSEGFLRRPGLDYSLVYAPLARTKTTRLVMAIKNAKWRSLVHIDVKSTVLIGPIEELIFVTRSLGFEMKDMEHMLYIE